MASEARLQQIVGKMVEKGWITPSSPKAAVEKAYRQVCYRERVPALTKDGWESWEEARPWGSGPNESYLDFERELRWRWWGRYDDAPDVWPEAYTPEERQLAAEFGVNPANLGGALWLQAEGLWEHYIGIVQDRFPTSPFHFYDLEFFVRAARELGVARVKRYPHAKTWAMARQIGFGIECNPGDCIELHAVLNVWSNECEAWKTLIEDVGGRRIAAVLREIPDATPHAVRVALRVAEAKTSPYFVEMAKHIPVGWDAIPTGTIRRILRDRPWETVKPEYRARLLAGESPQAIVAHLWEPVDRHTAHRWITETGGHVKPAVFYAVRVVGIPEVEFEHLLGTRGRIEKIVLDWYARKRTSVGMLRERPWRLPDGQLITIPLTAVIDEVRPEHLVNGVHTDPDHVFMSIMTTRGERPIHQWRPTGYWITDELRTAEKRSKPFPAWPERTPIPGITQVRTWNRLIDIGNREQHCAGEYAERCADGDTFMFEVNLDGAFSLFQITTNGRLVQHRAKANAKPIESHRAAVEEWIKENGTPAP